MLPTQFSSLGCRQYNTTKVDGGKVRGKNRVEAGFKPISTYIDLYLSFIQKEAAFQKGHQHQWDRQQKNKVQRLKETEIKPMKEHGWNG